MPHFEQYISAWDNCIIRKRREPPVDIQTMGTGEKSEVWLVLANFHRQSFTVGTRNIRWIRNDHFELLSRNWGQQIAVEQTDAFQHSVAFCIIPRYSQRSI